MANKSEEMQRIIRRYKDETGAREVDLHSVAKWAVGRGWPLPEPINPIDRLAKDFARAAREEIRQDRNTGRGRRGHAAHGGLRRCPLGRGSRDQCAKTTAQPPPSITHWIPSTMLGLLCAPMCACVGS